MNVLANVLINQDQVNSTFKKYEETFFSIQSIGVTYRIINNWDKNDLLILNRKNSNAWRKFNWFEWGWVEVIQHLRSWGLAIEKIKAIKQQLFSEKVLIDNEKKSLFDVLLVLTALEQGVFFLRIYEDATCLLLQEKNYQSEDDLLKTHLTIPFNKIVTHINSKKTIELDVKDLYQLNNQQATLIDKIRQSAFEKIIFFYPNKPSLTLDINKEENIENKSIELIKNTDYQKIYLFESNGDIFQVENNPE